MQSDNEAHHQDVIHEALQCAVNAHTCAQAEGSGEPTKVVDMATTGDIPEGYTHLVFVAFGTTGYVVSRNLQGQYKVEIRDQITS